MAANPAGKLVRYIRDLAEAEATKGLTDGQLLALFVQQRAEAAFAGLMKRHGRLVWSICRHLLRDGQDAEDAFQATFLILARRPTSIRKAEAVGSWLHGVAYRVAVKAMKKKRKRQMHERAAAAPALSPTSDLALRELQAILDEEVRGLPEKYRAPFLLCCLEGRTREEASKELDCNEGTVSSRIARARRLLQERLTRRGVTLAAALCAGDLWTNMATASLPAALAASTIKAACGAAGGTGFAGASAGAMVLADGVVRAMTLAKWQVGAVIFLAVSLTVTTAALSGRQTPTASAPDAKSANVPAIVVKKDLYGDALPLGAVARLGTVRQRAPGAQVAITADGIEIVTLDPDLVVRRFDALTGKLSAAHQLTARERWAPRLSPRGTLALVSAFAQPAGQQLELWDIAKGMCVQTLPLGNRAIWDVNSMAFSADQSQVAFADMTPDSSTHRVVLWDLKTSKSHVLWSVEKNIPERYFFPVVAIAPDGKRVVACHLDRVLRCWEIESRKLLWEAKNQWSGLLFFSPDSRTVIGTSRVNISGINRRDAATGKLVDEEDQPPKDAVYPMGFSPDGKFMAFEDGFEGLVLWKARASKTTMRLPPPEPRTRFGHYTKNELPNNFVFTSDGKALIRRQGPLQRWDLDTGKPVFAVTEGWGHTDKITRVIFSPDGRHLASCSADETVRLWDCATSRMLHVFPKGRSDQLAFSPDGRHFLSVANFGAHGKNGLRQWDMARATPERDFKLPEPKPSRITYYGNDTDLRVTPNGKILLLNWTQESNESILTTWDAATGVLVGQKPVARTESTILTPDGGSVLTFEHWTEDVMLVDIDSGKPRWHMQTDRAKDPQVRLNSCNLTVSPSGRLMAARSPLANGNRYVGYDAIRVGDMTTGRQLAKLPISGPAVFAFSTDERIFAVAGARSVRLWEIASWQEIGSLNAATGSELGAGEIQSLALAADGRTLATGHADSTILLWDATLSPGAAGRKLTVAGAEALWTDLGGADAKRAYAAVWRLVDDSYQAVSLLKDRLKPVNAAPPEMIQALLHNLDSSQFQQRDAARQKLQVLGELAEPALRLAMKGNPSLELRRRLEALLERLNPAAPLNGATLRGVRAVQVLEKIGTPEARSILAGLGQGLESARLTRAAREALARMEKR